MIARVQVPCGLVGSLNLHVGGVPVDGIEMGYGLGGFLGDSSRSIPVRQLKLKWMQARFSWIAQHRRYPGGATGAEQAQVSSALHRRYLDRVART